jgi:glycosyltransferase involved in cell wall biosynthesis
MIRYVAMTPSLAQPGGAERHIYALLANVDPQRLRCKAVVLAGNGGADPDLCRAIRAAGVPIVGDRPRGVSAPREAGLVDTPYRDLHEAVLVACAGADVLITWGSLAMGRFTAGLPIPVVCVSHCAEASNLPISGITHLVGVSKAATSFWGGLADEAGLPVDIIPNGVEVDRCIPRRGRAWQRAQWGLTDDHFVIGYAGRGQMLKRPGACIRALTCLPDNYRAVLVGPPPRGNPGVDLVGLASNLGVADRVTIVPKRVDMGDAYAAMDCLMLASEREADSLTLKEAMLCGLPVCATRVGAVPELEEEFGEGMVVIPVFDGTSAADLANAVRYTSDGIGIGRDIADRMRRVAWDRWTAQAMAERWTSYITRVVREWSGESGTEA